MKNLKVNKELVKRISALGLSVALISGALTGCSLNKKEEEDNKFSFIDVNGLNSQKECNFENLVLINKDTKEAILNNIQVKVGDSMKYINNPVEVMFTDDVEYLIIDNTFVSISEFTLMDTVSQKTIDEFETVRINGNSYLISDIKSLIPTESSKEEIETLVVTENDITNAMINLSAKLSQAYIEYTDSEVAKAIIYVNYDALTSDINRDLYNNLLVKYGISSYEDLRNSYDMLTSKINMVNYDNFYNKNVAYENLLDYSSIILSPEQKDLYTQVVCELVKQSYMLDSYELNRATKDFYKEFTSNNGKYSRISTGTKIALMMRFAEFRSMIYMDCNPDDRAMDNDTLNVIKYFAPQTFEEMMANYVNGDNEVVPSYTQDIASNAYELYQNTIYSKKLTK